MPSTKLTCNLNPEQFKKLYQEIGKHKLARLLGISNSRIDQLRKEYNIPAARPSIGKSTSDISDDELKRLFKDEKMTIAQIAKKFNKNSWGINRRLRDLGLHKGKTYKKKSKKKKDKSQKKQDEKPEPTKKETKEVLTVSTKIEAEVTPLCEICKSPLVLQKSEKKFHGISIGIFEAHICPDHPEEKYWTDESFSLINDKIKELISLGASKQEEGKNIESPPLVSPYVPEDPEPTSQPPTADAPEISEEEYDVPSVPAPVEKEEPISPTPQSPKQPEMPAPTPMPEEKPTAPMPENITDSEKEKEEPNETPPKKPTPKTGDEDAEQSQ